MKAKSIHDQNIEKRVNAVFYQREDQHKSFDSSKRVPKQDHYAISTQKNSHKK